MPDSLFSDSIDPKAYPTYEDYLDALEARRKFEAKSKEISGIVAKNDSHEDLVKDMEAIGFAYYEDEFCERKWCNKNKMCLLTTLESIQENYNNYFFNGVLSEKDFLVPKKDLEAMLCGRGCKLPEKNPKTFKAIEFLLAVDEALCFDNIFNKSWKAISKKEVVKHFGRSLYLFVISAVNNRDPQTYYEKLESSFHANEIFDASRSEKFLKIMETLCD